MADERRESPPDPERTVEEETVELRGGGIPEPEGYPYDGDLEAGPRPGGGYRVAATLRYTAS